MNCQDDLVALGQFNLAGQTGCFQQSLLALVWARSQFNDRELALRRRGVVEEAVSPGRGWSSKTRPLSGVLHAPELCFTTVPLTVSAADVCDCRNPGPGLGASPDGQSPITARKVAMPATVRTVASKRRALVGLCRGFVGFGLACAGSVCRAGAGFECAAGSACRAGPAEVSELG